MFTSAFKEIANSAPTMIWMSDKNKKHLFFNKNWLEYRGMDIEGELSSGWEEMIFSEDLEKRNNKLSDSFRNLKPYKIEYRLKKHDGSFRWIIESGTPYYDAQSQFAGVLGSCIDIHSIKEAERQKDEFVTAASHELRTPLTSLGVYLHFIEEYFNKNPVGDYPIYSKEAVLQLEKINSLISNLLDVNKIRGGRLDYVWKIFPFFDFVKMMVEKAKVIYPHRDFQLTGHSAGMIKGDRMRLEDALMNLLDNAVKYSESNTKILIEVSEESDDVCLSILDFGIGIEKEHIPYLFNQFFRVPGRYEQTYPGMGIGLYIVKETIAKHRGVISVESEKNKFTRFTTKIPLLKD
jgi:PAS domain S-box-containing protein